MEIMTATGSTLLLEKVQTETKHSFSFLLSITIYNKYSLVLTHYKNIQAFYLFLTKALSGQGSSRHLIQNLPAQ